MTKTVDLERAKVLLLEHREEFEQFYSRLLEANAKFNLTAITEKEDVFHKHFLDSLAGEQFFGKGEQCAEVGSGAGFPSIPLLLVRKDLSFACFESINKKCEFLKAMIAEFSLHAKVYCLRAEDAARGEHREKYGICTARAVAKMNTLAEYCLPLVKRGGTFLAYKGEDEREIGASAVRILGGGETECVFYSLPKDYGKRSLLVTVKERPTPAKYPRGRGAERRDPL